MAQTTEAINSCDVVIKLDNGEGNLADISGSSNSVSHPGTQKIGEAYTFGSHFPVRKAGCGKDATITLNLVYSMSDAEALYLLNDWFYNDAEETRTVKIYKPDTSVGSDVYTYECLIQDWDPGDAKAGDANPILAKAVLKPTGDYTWEVVGS